MSAAEAAFDTVVVVDWSSANAPSPRRPSADAIWIGTAGPDGETARYCRTRAEAEGALSEQIDTALALGRRILVGFDFPIGYPQGFAARLTGSPEPKGVWRWLAENLSDGPDNRNNRFHLADRINAQLGGPGPFWGRPHRLDLHHLPSSKHVDCLALGLVERRHVETLVPRAQPVWKLFTTGSVGAQSLTGLPMIHRLSQRPGTKVWPFDAHDTPVVLAEIYPSLLDAEVRAVSGSIKDEVQVRLLSRALLSLSRRGILAPLMSVPDIALEEGWILGAGHVQILREALA